MDVRSALRWISILETASFLVLLAMMFTHNETGVSVVGATHGLLFLAYAAILWYGRTALRWTWQFALGGIVTGPIGAIIVLERLRREGRAVADRSPRTTT